MKHTFRAPRISPGLATMARDGLLIADRYLGSLENEPKGSPAWYASLAAYASSSQVFCSYVWLQQAGTRKEPAWPSAARGSQTATRAAAQQMRSVSESARTPVVRSSQIAIRVAARRPGSPMGYVEFKVQLPGIRLRSNLMRPHKRRIPVDLPTIKGLEVGSFEEGYSPAVRDRRANHLQPSILADFDLRI